MAYQGQGEDALARFRRNHIGIVFQSFHLMPTMTALENVTLPLELANDKNARLEKAEAALDEVGLLARKTHYPSQLSGGEQQRVALARAMIGNPVLLLADEPTGNLDQKSGQQIMDLIFSLREKKARRWFWSRMSARWQKDVTAFLGWKMAASCKMISRPIRRQLNVSNPRCAPR